jgi:hypothetical protein
MAGSGNTDPSPEVKLREIAVSIVSNFWMEVELFL